jgi:hypothetical protein
VLARRLLYTAPLEANDLLRGLADDGVIAAIGRLSLHLRGLAQHRDRLARRWTDDARAGMAAWEAAGTDLRTEALAWGLLAESFEGLPRGTGVDRTWNATGEPPPELAIACERAAELHAQLEAAWAESGSAAVSVEASPVLFTVTADDAYLEACPADLLPTPSFDGCRPFRVRGGYEDELAFACPGD